MALSNPIASRFPEIASGSVDPFAMQLALSRDHTRLVPMQRVAGGYELDPGAEDWFELAAGRGLAGYGLGRALRMLLDVLRGLTALHDTFSMSGEPFAHGEVAPINFRVDTDGVCRVVPLTARHATHTELEPAPAALGHVAPERLLNESVDARADVFSAGVLLWEALAGSRLFDESTADAIIDRLLGAKLQMPQLPPELAWAIPLKSVATRALAVNPYQRFADCAELATAIAIVARERVATHAEVAAFFAASNRAREPRALRERPVPTQSSTFPAVGTPASRRASTLAPLGPSSSRPPPPVTPIGAAHRSPFSALLLPQPEELPAIPPPATLPQIDSALEPLDFDAEESATLLVAPRETRRPPPLPVIAPPEPALPMPTPPPFAAQTLPAVTGLAMLEPDEASAIAALRPARARQAWLALLVCALGGASFGVFRHVNALSTLAARAPLSNVRPEPEGAPVASPADHSRGPLATSASAGSAHTEPNNVSAPHAVEMHAAPHVPKSAKAAKNQRTNATDYGI